MSNMDRRQFLKIMGISTVFGMGMASTPAFLEKLDASSFGKTPGRLAAKRWGMYIDMDKINEQDAERIIHACHSAHNVPLHANKKHEVKWIWTEEFGRAFPEQEGEYMAGKLEHREFLVLCNHCDKPACTRVCPTKATYKRKEDGLVLMDYHRCIGCRFCMAACPYGARSFNYIDPRPVLKEQNEKFPTRMIGVVEKCTFCSERLDKGLKPACVEASNGAMIFGDLNDPNSELRKAIHEHFTLRRKPELGTNPGLYYKIGGAEHAG
ncbi:MAG: sulfate reduction electron transfer complex DsrMKJOP subunit DsrO [Nitrospirota bacterium]